MREGLTIHRLDEEKRKPQEESSEKMKGLKIFGRETLGSSENSKR